MTGRVGGAIGRIFAAGVVTCGLVAAAGDDVTRRIEEIKPPEALLGWQRIPWVTDLTEGQRLARREHRPIFLWASGDDPLERC
jgi:hypothetical protein